MGSVPLPGKYTASKEGVMKAYLSYPIFMMFYLIILGCNNNDSPPAQTDPPKNQYLQGEVNLLKQQVFRLQTQLTNFTDGSASISTEDKGYDIAQTKFGSFAVVCRNASPYLDGYKIRLGIGNLTSASFRGAKINVWWGENSKEFDVTDSFVPGRYTTIEVVLTPAKPEDIKALTVSLEFNTIFLYR